MTGWLLGLGFVVVAVVIGYVPARLMRHRYGARQPGDTRALTSDVMARVGALHGLILALVFANAQQGAGEFEAETASEAVAVTEVYFNAQRLGAQALQAASTDYLRASIEHDWPSLHSRQELSDEGWRAWRRMLEASLALAPDGRAQALLADGIHANVVAIQSLRQNRGFHAQKRLSIEFWIVSVAGLLLVATLLFVHEVSPTHDVIMAMYSAFTGLTIFMIYDLSHPFGGTMQLRPDAYHAALAMIRSGV